MFGMPKVPTHIPTPEGRIRSREELRDLIIEARKERKAIRIYLVQQSGYMSEFFLTSKSKLQKPDAESGLCSGDSFYRVNGRRLSSLHHRGKPKDRYYADELLTGSYNIGCNGGSVHHFAFTNRALAERYSNTLKNDPIYRQYVKDWHAYCDRSFGRMWAS